MSSRSPSRCKSVLRRKGETDRETRPIPLVAVDADRAVVRLDDRLRDVEPQPETAVVAARDVARTMEALEQLRDLVPRDADAAIGDRRQHDPTRHARPQL